MPYTQQLVSFLKRKVTGISTEPVLPAALEVSITAVMSEACSFSISEAAPYTVTLMLLEVTSAT